MERIYLDTSVFGGYFEPEFETWTKILFERILGGHYLVLYSRMTDDELILAPSQVKELATTMPAKHIEVIEISPE